MAGICPQTQSKKRGNAFKVIISLEKYLIGLKGFEIHFCLHIFKMKGVTQRSSEKYLPLKTKLTNFPGKLI